MKKEMDKMIELVKCENIMVVEFEVYGELIYRFEKHASSSTMVNVFVDGLELDCFNTHYVGSSMERFTEVCETYLYENE